METTYRLLSTLDEEIDMEIGETFEVLDTTGYYELPDGWTLPLYRLVKE